MDGRTDKKRNEAYKTACGFCVIMPLPVQFKASVRCAHIAVCTSVYYTCIGPVTLKTRERQRSVGRSSNGLQVARMAAADLCRSRPFAISQDAVRGTHDVAGKRNKSRTLGRPWAAAILAT